MLTCSLLILHGSTKSEQGAVATCSNSSLNLIPFPAFRPASNQVATAPCSELDPPDGTNFHKDDTGAVLYVSATVKLHLDSVAGQSLDWPHVENRIRKAVLALPNTWENGQSGVRHCDSLQYLGAYAPLPTIIRSGAFRFLPHSAHTTIPVGHCRVWKSCRSKRRKFSISYFSFLICHRLCGNPRLITSAEKERQEFPSLHRSGLR